MFDLAWQKLVFDIKLVLFKQYRELYNSNWHWGSFWRVEKAFLSQSCYSVCCTPISGEGAQRYQWQSIIQNKNLPLIGWELQQTEDILWWIHQVEKLYMGRGRQVHVRAMMSAPTRLSFLEVQCKTQQSIMEVFLSLIGLLQLWNFCQESAMFGKKNGIWLIYKCYYSLSHW